MNKDYLFTSERLGFRNWKISDLEEMSVINADVDVMKHFPQTLTKEETAAFIDRQKAHYEKFGYNYFATEVLESGEFIGFIGFSALDFEAEFTPATDIGWRLKKNSWGNGYATEGAKKCLEFAFNELNLEKIILIDYPGFNLSLAKSLKSKVNIPIIYYISPQVWAWKENRISKIKRDLDALYVILPFEEPGRGLLGRPFLTKFPSLFQLKGSLPL